jgi:hypothetical protein
MVMARTTRPASASASSVIASGGSAEPLMRCAIRDIGAPMSRVRISAGPESVDEAIRRSCPITHSDAQAVRPSRLLSLSAGVEI